MMSLLLCAALRLSSRESNVIGNRIEERRLHVVVTENHGVLFQLQLIDLGRELSLDTKSKSGTVLESNPASFS
jgi:hypothetical protein